MGARVGVRSCRSSGGLAAGWRSKRRHLTLAIATGATLAGTAVAQPETAPAAEPSSGQTQTPDVSAEPAPEDRTPSAGPSPDGTQPSSDKTGYDSVNSELDARARRHWDSGMAYLEESDPTSALAAFDKAYQLSRRPRILLAIAVAHEQRGDLARAIAALDTYLQREPQANNAAEVIARRAALRTRYEAQLRELRQARKLAGATSAGSPSTPSATTPTGVTDKPGADERQLVMWTSLTIGAAAGIAAVGTGLAANHEYSNLEQTCAGHCSATDTRDGRSLALTSTILTGVAALGVGVGAWLLLSGPSSATENSGLTPHVTLVATPWGGLTQALWGF